jgi:hydroxypyruvate reductase 1
MATLAATNVAAVLQGWPAWDDPDIGAFLGSAPPQAAPSIVNARELGLAMVGSKGRAGASHPARRSP